MLNKIKNYIEYERCKRNPIYFINNYLKYTGFNGKETPIKLFDYQEKYIKSVQKNKLNLGAWSRQNGKTITNIAIVVWNLIFKNNETVIVYSFKETMNREIRLKIMEMLSSLPKWLLNETDVVFDNNRILVKYNKCLFMGPLVDIRTRASEKEVNLLVVDEFSLVMNENARNLIATFDNLDKAKISILSTLSPDPFHPFNSLFKDSKMGLNGFVSSQTSWKDNPNRDDAWAKKQMDIIGLIGFNREYC